MPPGMTNDLEPQDNDWLNGKAEIGITADGDPVYSVTDKDGDRKLTVEKDKITFDSHGHSQVIEPDWDWIKPEFGPDNRPDGDRLPPYRPDGDRPDLELPDYDNGILDDFLEKFDKLDEIINKLDGIFGKIFDFLDFTGEILAVVGVIKNMITFFKLLLIAAMAVASIWQN